MLGTFLFRIGNFGVPTMGACVLVGAVLAVLLSWLLRKKSALDWNGEVVDAIIYAVLLGFAGMKILYWIVTPDVFKTAFSDGFFRGILSLLMEGMVFYGGLLGGILGVFLTARKKKRNFFEFTDLMAPCFCVAHAFGRIGCLLTGCCYGVAVGETTQFGVLTYGGACAVKYLNGTMRLPVPLFEAIFLLLLCAALVLIFRKEKHLGTTTGWYLILYALWRFVIEMFRGDAERGKFGPLYTSQWISILILLAGVAILILSRRFGWKKGAPFRVFHEEDVTVPEPEEKKEPEKPEEPERIDEQEVEASAKAEAENAGDDDDEDDGDEAEGESDGEFGGETGGDAGGGDAE
ncbi:MAG: prolipoprotein diacylglyceryl transferase [Clostridia bacterium]|nr:prolipoprotein diacylglyceryl transferase [Clostridia bacterium]